MLINIVNKIIGITSYFLAQFVNKYLKINRSELAQNKLDSPKELAKLILTGNTI